MNSPDSFALYLHIPFCRSKCAYCDFFSIKTENNIENEYISALINEARLRKKQFGAKTWFSIYIGGGTPSLLTPQQIIFLLKELCQICPLEKDAEVTVECNPDDITEDFLQIIKNSLVNRLSLGIQSLNDKSLQIIGRRAKLAENLRAIELINKFWLCKNSAKSGSSGRRFSADLICGLPLQTEKDFLEDLQKIINCGADHISLYSLMLEENTRLFDMVEKGLCKINQDESDEWWILGRDLLEKNGFAQYEVSNFCKAGCESRHNLCYWQMQNYIGIGAGATGTVANLRYTNTTNIEKYVQFFRDFRENSEISDFFHLAQIEEIENLDRETQIFEFLMMGFRLLDGPNAEYFYSRFGENIEKYVKEPLSRWQKKNLAVCTENKYALNQQGLLLLNSFMQELF